MSTSLSAQDVGNLVAFVAPGYFAQWVYRRRFPARPRPAGELLIICAVLSLPFVALAPKIAPGADRDPTSLKYVAALLGPAVVAGFFAAMLRSASSVRAVLGELGFSEQPEASIWLRTLQYLPEDSWVTVELKDGATLAGVPRSFPGLPEDGVRELYLLHPTWEQKDGSFKSGDGEGVIVRLDEVKTITLEYDPTAEDAPP